MANDLAYVVQAVVRDELNLKIQATSDNFIGTKLRLENHGLSSCKGRISMGYHLANFI